MLIREIIKKLIIILFALSVLTFPSHGQDIVVRCHFNPKTTVLDTIKDGYGERYLVHLTTGGTIHFSKTCIISIINNDSTLQITYQNARIDTVDKHCVNGHIVSPAEIAKHPSYFLELQECSMIYDRKENTIRNVFISFGIFNIIRSIVGR